MKNKLFLLLIIWILSLSFIFILHRYPTPVSLLIYWVILGLFIFTIWFLKLASRAVLLFSFTLFIIAGLLTTFTVSHGPETILRISLLGWLIGFVQAIFEYIFKKK